MSEIKRRLIYVYDWDENTHKLDDWVKFTDHEKEIKRLEAERVADNQRWSKQCEEWKSRYRELDQDSTNYEEILQNRIDKLKRANEIAVKVLEAIATSSQKDEFLSDVEYRHRISGIYFSSEKALSEIKGIL